MFPLFHFAVLHGDTENRRTLLQKASRIGWLVGWMIAWPHFLPAFLHAVRDTLRLKGARPAAPAAHGRAEGKRG